MLFLGVSILWEGVVLDTGGLISLPELLLQEMFIALVLSVSVMHAAEIPACPRKPSSSQMPTIYRNWTFWL